MVKGSMLYEAYNREERALCSPLFRTITCIGSTIASPSIIRNDRYTGFLAQGMQKSRMVR